MFDIEKLKQKAEKCREIFKGDNSTDIQRARVFDGFIDWYDTQGIPKTDAIKRKYDEAVRALCFVNHGYEEKYSVDRAGGEFKKLKEDTAAWKKKNRGRTFYEVIDWPRPAFKAMAALVSEETVREIEGAINDDVYAATSYSLKELWRLLDNDSGKPITLKRLKGLISREARRPSGKYALIKKDGENQYRILKGSFYLDKIRSECTRENRGGNRNKVK